MVTGNPDILEKLKVYEDRLARFCYSIYNLAPKSFLCKSAQGEERVDKHRAAGIWKMSSASPPVLKRKYYEVTVNETEVSAAKQHSSVEPRRVVKRLHNHTGLISLCMDFE